MSQNSLYNGPTITTANSVSPIIPSSKIYRGFSTVNKQSPNPALYDLQLIKQDLMNQFNIRQGEKLSDPNFGTIIWDMIYEPLTEQAKQLITQNVTDIVNYDPRTTVNYVNVTEYNSGIQIECSLTYLTYNISDKIIMNFDQNIGLT